MTPELSQRLGRALGTHSVTVAEREAVVAASRTASTWADLSSVIRSLVIEIENRTVIT